MPTPKFTSIQAHTKIETIRMLALRHHRISAQLVCDTLQLRDKTAYCYLAHMTEAGLLQRLEDESGWVLGPMGHWRNHGQPIQLQREFCIKVAHRRRDPMVAALFGPTGLAHP